MVGYQIDLNSPLVQFLIGGVILFTANTIAVLIGVYIFIYLEDKWTR